LIDVLHKLSLNPHNALMEDHLQQLLKTTHHSVNDAHQLRQLVQRYVTLTGELPMQAKQYADAKALRTQLKQSLAQTPLCYGEID